MNKFDISKVDLKLLQIFQAVFEEGSITAASTRLHLSQPLISHALGRLRQAFSDPLFIRAGRTITPTERARDLAPIVTRIIEQLLSLAEPEQINNQQINTLFTLSGNDYERRLIAPNLLQLLLKQAPNASLRLMNTSDDFTDELRIRRSDVVITPIPPPDQLDFYSEPLFRDQHVCFYDPEHLTAEEIKTSYLKLDHAMVQLTHNGKSRVDLLLESIGKQRQVKLIVPNFESLPFLMKGTRLVASLPSRLAQTMFHQFAFTELPLQKTELDFNIIWHRSTHQSAQYRWFRSLIRETVQLFL